MYTKACRGLLPLFAALTATTSASQVPLGAESGAALSSSISSLFADPPAPSTPPICCGPSCPPQACNVAAATLSKDLLYLNPLPTAPQTTKSLTFPCCGADCPDGACRGPTPITSARPTAKPTRPPHAGGPVDGLLPDPQQGGAGDQLSVIIGCCKGCRGCRHSAQNPPDEETMLVRAPIQSQDANICIGCVGGICHPCIQSAIATIIAFTPDVTEPATASATASTTDNAALRASTSTSTPTTEAQDPPEPTFLLAADYALAIQGANQDAVPLIVQAHDVDTTLDPSSDGTSLITLLATLDLKLAHNYLSRRVLHALGLSDKLVPFSKKSRAAAVLDGTLTLTALEGYVDLAIVIGSRVGGSGTARWTYLGQVRWFVHGLEEGGVVGAPDVLLGTRVLGEIGGLGAVEGVRREVAAGVRVLGVGHAVGKGPAGAGAKDEL
jgi:hypothetical protein